MFGNKFEMTSYKTHVPANTPLEKKTNSKGEISCS